MKKQKYHVYIFTTATEEDDSTTIDYAYCQCPIGYVELINFHLIIKIIMHGVRGTIVINEILVVYVYIYIGISLSVDLSSYLLCSTAPQWQNMIFMKFCI